jgi:CheY-specific phosphatase CheX
MQADPFEPWLVGAVTEVLESMCFLTAVPISSNAANAEGAWVCYRLHFSGPCQGQFGLGATLPTARLVACNLLGVEPEELNDIQVGESTGEIANMVCGAMLSRMESKHAFDLSHPVRDHERMETSAAGGTRVAQRFALEHGELEVWIEVKQN